MKKLYAYTKLDFGYDTVYDRVSDRYYTRTISYTEVKYLADVNIPTITLPDGVVWSRAEKHDILVPDVHSTKDT